MKLGLNKIDLALMIEKKLIKNTNKPVKVLANGKIDKSVEIFANAFSESAMKKIEKNGGKAHII